MRNTISARFACCPSLSYFVPTPASQREMADIMPEFILVLLFFS